MIILLLFLNSNFHNLFKKDLRKFQLLLFYMDLFYQFEIQSAIGNLT